MKKRYLIIALIIVMAIFTNMTASASSSKPKITVTTNGKAVKYNSSPYMENGILMVPVRQTAEALGGKVEWNKKNSTVWIHFDMMHVELIVGKSEFYIHRDADFSGIPQTVKLKKPVQRIRGKVFVPARTVFENMGMVVSWNSKSRVLSIDNLTKDVVYEEIIFENIQDNKKLAKWYQENNQKLGITSIRDGKYIYALIGAGERPTGGFTISIDQIFYSTYDTVTINAKVTPPGDNVRVIMAITYPATLIRIKSDTIKTIDGEIIDVKTPSKEKWITLDSTTVAKMELFNLDQVKIKDVTGTEKDDIMKSFNEATIDQNSYIEMITGNILKVTTIEGYSVTFTSYGSETNVIANIEMDNDTRSFHLVAPVIAKAVLQK